MLLFPPEGGLTADPLDLEAVGALAVGALEGALVAEGVLDGALAVGAARDGDRVVGFLEGARAVGAARDGDRVVGAD